MSEDVKRNDFLKIIGIISMTIDHIGIIMLPENILLRGIGRIAFPLFAYKLSQGVRYTANIKKYALRIAFVGIISQPIYYAFMGSEINIMYDLFFGVIVLALLKSGKNANKITAVLIAVIFSVADKGYGAYAMACFFAFYYIDTAFEASIAFFIAATFIYSFSAVIQIIAVLALPLILLEDNVHICMPKYFFYLYYPAHIAVIGIIHYFIS